MGSEWGYRCSGGTSGEMICGVGGGVVDKRWGLVWGWAAGSEDTSTGVSWGDIGYTGCIEARIN